MVRLIGGGAVSAAMVAAVFLSNIPESLSAAAEMKTTGRSKGCILRLWTAVMVVLWLVSLFGYLFLAGAPGA